MEGSAKKAVGSASKGRAKLLKKKLLGRKALKANGLKTNGKVIQFKKSSPSSSRGKLSAAEQESTVLEYRMKARSLAHSILRRWHSRLDQQEVESIVDLSLCEAVKRYDRKKGASFITFLFYHLRGNLIRAVTTAASLNYIPLPDLDLGESVNGESGGRSKIINAVDLSEHFCHHDYESPDDTLLKKELARLSTDACSRLDPLEKEVVYRIYVLEQQLMDIARSLGYSRCHISRVKRKALEALHGDLAPVIHPEGKATELNFSDDDNEELQQTELQQTERKVIRRRKMRSVTPKIEEPEREALAL